MGSCNGWKHKGLTSNQSSPRQTNKGSVARRMDCDMIFKMAAKKPNFDLTCPCCGAVLKVDSETEAVISYVAPVKPKMFNDLDDAARAMKEQDSRRDSIFRQSIEAQKHAADLLEKKFQEALRKAKESPDTGKPIRDFDLD
jgi:hypothetical protein